MVLASPIFVVVFGAIGAVLPFMWIKRRQRRRLEAFQAQLPDAIDMLVSAMKAGYSFQAAMNFIGQETPAPLGPEFARFYDEQRLGIDVRSALLSLQTRVDSMDLKMFVTAVLVQRESGGNLGEVLANISDIMRERFALEGELETLTAESRLSARILAALPVLVFLGMFALNPSFMRPMLQQTAGQAMLVLALVSVGLGYLVMVRISDIDV
jgi:tight adherence protein B